MIQKISANQRRHAGHGPFQIDILFPGINQQPQMDPGFYNLGRFDHAQLAPGAFVGMHPHKNDEILSLLKKGTMLHKDTAGNEIAVSPTHLMMMNAGSGIYHEESIPIERYNQNVEMLQIFIRPEKENEPPQVQFADFDESIELNTWRLIGANKNAPFIIRSEIAVWDVTLNDYSIAPPVSAFNSTAYLVYVFDGEVEVVSSGLRLNKGDAITAMAEDDLQLKADEATLVAFVINREAKYTRNGMYSGLK